MIKTENYIGHHTEVPEGYEYLDTTPKDYGQDLDVDWVGMARDAYKTSNDYFEASISKQAQKNLAMFQSRHPQGSKYHSESYKHRSKIFRPKLRSAIMRREASGAAAYFSTQDVVNCLPENPDDKLAALGSEIARDLLNYRLEHSVPWFLTAMGAYQDAMVQGLCITRQEWEFKEELRIGPEGEVENVVVKDSPTITLVPIENFRFDPAAEWIDPVNTSPYLIEIIPMYVCDVRAKMQSGVDRDGQPAWNQLAENDIRIGTQTGRYDATRHARENKRQDSKDFHTVVSDYEVVWVHRNIVRYEGVDWLYYTMGTEHLLSEPVPVNEVYPHGRPYVIGYCTVETHKCYPASQTEIGEGLQTEANDIANQRLDNIKLALNRRYLARRGANVDWRSLMNSVPGGVTLVDDVQRDVKIDAPQDVTSSSYQEQDRVSNDLDDILGTFSAGSVQSNKALNETVGGMTLLSQDANVLNEYQLRVFTETWTEKVLKQVLELERAYETDQAILSLVAREGATPDQVLQLLQAPMTVRVSVGFGATNPQKRIERLSMGLNTIGTFAPALITERLNIEAAITEVFGALGFRDGTRFFKPAADQDPAAAQSSEQMQALQQQVQELTAKLQSKEVEAQSRIQIEQLRQQGSLEREKIKTKLARDLAVLEQQIAYIDQQIKAEANDIKRGELQVQKDAFTFSKKAKELDYAIAERDRMSDVLMRDAYGLAPGIDEKPGPG